MDELLAARLSMGTSLGFHIIYASIGMTMPFFMTISHYLYLKTKKAEYLILTKMWMRGVAILFAIGAVSGTMLSFELGLLWPGFMKYAGPIIGMPFSWEGTAFFIEAIALGLYLYGWNKMRPWLHWWTGVVVGVSGFASGVFVVAANSWMNTPQGFDWANGVASNIDPVKAMFNPAWLHQTLHMQVAAIQAVGFAVAGVHAYLLLKKKHYSLNMRALIISLALGSLASLAQPLIGHYAAQKVAVLQPVKLAAIEGLFETTRYAPLSIGGIPNKETKELDYALQIPGALSFLAFNRLDAKVKGLETVPEDEWPPLSIVHLSFQLMVAIGSIMAVIGAYFLYLFWRKKFYLKRKFLKLLVFTTPLGFIAIEAGWIVTEVGRQPWIIYGFLKTKDAMTPVPGMVIHFFLFLIVYIFLSFMTLWLLKRQVQAAHEKVVQEIQHD